MLWKTKSKGIWNCSPSNFHMYEKWIISKSAKMYRKKIKMFPPLEEKYEKQTCWIAWENKKQITKMNAIHIRFRIHHFCSLNHAIYLIDVRIPFSLIFFFFGKQFYIHSTIISSKREKKKTIECILKGKKEESFFFWTTEEKKLFRV